MERLRKFMVKKWRGHAPFLEKWGAVPPLLYPSNAGLNLTVLYDVVNPCIDDKINY